MALGRGSWGFLVLTIAGIGCGSDPGQQTNNAGKPPVTTPLPGAAGSTAAMGGAGRVAQGPAGSGAAGMTTPVTPPRAGTTSTTPPATTAGSSAGGAAGTTA